ncbi:pre-mRNA-splicing factor CWC25-like [Belonocnema kinseyi]|uniref:pre-mRNA-splicing factor CWC25-like n=1 Tax=Belonocnema kinseyi TaxID=2817044 RepID=UPI00143CF904|nr:pre-mRNA-splicing factor CWC25-like [Belonocnema kinseyi]
MHEDGRPHKIVGNINLVAKGQTIIGYDGHCRGHNHINLGIFNADGERVFQNREDRADIWRVDFRQARDWGVYEPSPSDPPLPDSYYMGTPQYPRRLSQRSEGGDTERDRSRSRARNRSTDRARDRSRDRSRDTSRDRATVRGRGRPPGRGRVTGSGSSGRGGNNAPPTTSP